MSIENKKIIVIGAGASGLSFALACAYKGIKVRVIEKRSARSLIGKATGVSLGTWRQLEKFGITPSSTNAKSMCNFAFFYDEKLLGKIKLPFLNGKPAAHLFPQSMLEAAIEEKLQERGVSVEYGLEITSIQKNGAVTLNNKNQTTEKIKADLIIGADGAHSYVRNQLNIPFNGRDYPEKWSVAEIKSNEWPTDLQAQLYLRNNGIGLFLSQPIKGQIQGIINSPEIESNLLSKFTDGEVLYSREFNVSLRKVTSPKIENVWLIGDAAHIQSPIGGQGLNLAIWDGITLAEGLMNEDNTTAFVLSKKAKKILMFTDFDYRMLSSKNLFVQFIRNLYWSITAKFPALSKWFFKIIAGI